MSRAPAVAGVGGTQDHPGRPDSDTMARVRAADVNEAGPDRAVLDYPAAGRRRGRWGWRVNRQDVGWQRVGWQGVGGPWRSVGQDGGGDHHQGDDRDKERGNLPTDKPRGARTPHPDPPRTNAHAEYNSTRPAGLAAARSYLADRDALGLKDAQHHALGEIARLPHGIRGAGFVLGPLLEQAVELFIEELRDQRRRVGHLAAVFRHFDFVHGPLGNHVAVDPVGRQVFHIAVQQARALTVEHAVAVTDDGANRIARPLQSPLTNALRTRAKVFVNVGVGTARLDLVRIRELVDRNLILVRMAGPGAVHQAVRLVLLVLLQHFERARVELGVFTAGVEGGHPADGQHAALVADLGH